MNLNVLHQRLLQDVLEVGNALRFVITGGYAVQAHGLVDRFSRDIDVATESSVSMEVMVDTLIKGLTSRGWQVRLIGIEPLSARLMVTDSVDGQDCEVDILKEAFNWPPQDTPWGPVLGLDDVIGTKVRALASRGYPRDLIDIHAAARVRSHADLESLGRLHARDELVLEDLASRLDGSQFIEDEDFAAYGLSEGDIAELRRWTQAWCDDIRRRLYAENFDYAEDDYS
jgi:hypothetical protein